MWIAIAICYGSDIMNATIGVQRYCDETFIAAGYRTESTSEWKLVWAGN